MSVRRKLGASSLVATALVCVSVTPGSAFAYHNNNWPPNQEESPPQDEWPPPEDSPPPADEWPGDEPPAESYTPPAPTVPEPTPTVPTYQSPYDPSRYSSQPNEQPQPAIPEPVIHPVKGAIILKVLSTGDVKAPNKASRPIRKMVAAANRINGLRYLYGGSHGNAFFSPNPRSFDCSSAVSYVLYAAGLITGPSDSSGLMHWGVAGPGKQLTVYSNRGHAFMVIGNLRFDTGRASETYGKPSSGPRWGLLRPTQRFKVRHYPGL